MKIQKNAYLAVGYACNQKCRCCPITHDLNPGDLVAPFSRIEKEADAMVSFGVTDVTVSGGEPTVHPRFFDIIRLFLDRGLTVHILSNSERLSNPEFLSGFLEIAKGKPVCITTTFHSHLAREHEYQNGSKGSFERSLFALKALDENGVNVAVKHCITASNYAHLPEFLRWASEHFSPRAEIQLWGIDVCGISEKMAKEVFIEYPKIGKVLEKALDQFEEKDQSGRSLTVNNLPLCMCDSYYWTYFTPPESDHYIEHMQKGRRMDDISGPASKNCEICKFRAYCSGVYYSNFALFGDGIVSPPVRETKIASFCAPIVSYDEKKLSLTFFSPYAIFSLLPEGFCMENTRTGARVILRMKTEETDRLCRMLTEGAEDEKILRLLREFGLDGEKLLEELIWKGIVE